MNVQSFFYIRERERDSGEFTQNCGAKRGRGEEVAIGAQLRSMGVFLHKKRELIKGGKNACLGANLGVLPFQNQRKAVY